MTLRPIRVAQKPRAINAEVDNAVLDEFGDVKSVETAFPLKIRLALPKDLKEGVWYQKVIEGKSYVVYPRPILDKSGRAVGTVVSFEEISGQLRVLEKQKRFNSDLQSMPRS
jgi:hypothetical protein